MTLKTPRQTTPEPNTDGWQRSIDEADGEWDSHGCEIRCASKLAHALTAVHNKVGAATCP